MLKSIKNYFEELLQNNSDEQSTAERTVELATAVLMIEISLADDNLDESERILIREQLTNKFHLSDQEVADLIQIAEKEVDHAVSLHEFTRLLTDMLSMPERIDVLRNLWRVAFADAILDKYEEYAIRKVADLLYVSHADFIKAKHDAEAN